MVKCNGRGAGGDHCCYIASEVCPILEFVDGVPRCPLWDGQMIGNPVWDELPVGKWFAEKYPGYDCRDWPQNIPEVMKVGVGLCCWQEVTIS